MSGFEKRGDDFEKKFALDEELRFKAEARRNKLLGLWAAEKLGKTGADAEAYAKSVVTADFEEAGDGDVFRKVRKDFDAAGVQQSDHQLRRTMDELPLESWARLAPWPKHRPAPVIRKIRPISSFRAQGPISRAKRSAGFSICRKNAAPLPIL